ncbi:MAG: sigma-70 family RNA polymerase sigma factor [Planctomycetes bacterium]|nr:sigma-70 family RNA polymerase sigma factor [Planctomycetota bacterium]
MSEPSLEVLFERYRAQGELEALGAVFDRTAPELLALAMHLVRDPVEAEDLVQTTFVAAIEGARSFEGGRRLEPWLAGILARQAARAHRERGRTPDPARLERADSVDPLEHAERRELSVALARGLGELSPPYREVLERYLAGEKPLDIARSAGRAPGAVRMQILRALEKLRRILPAGLYGVVPLARAPRGLDVLRSEVLRQGGLALGAGTAAVAAPILGGLLVSTKVVLSVAAAAALALVFLLRSTRETTPHELVANAESAVPAAAPAELAPTTNNVRAPEREPASVTPPAVQPAPTPAAAPTEPASASGVFLVGALLGLDGLAPSEVEIAVEGIERKTHGSRDGRYAFDVSALVQAPGGAPAALYVEAVHPAGRRVTLEYALRDGVRAADPARRTELVLDLDLSARTAVAGRVEVGAGLALADVRVALARPVRGDEDQLDGEPVAKGSCDAQGRFLLFPRDPGEYVVVAHAWGAPAAVARVRAAEGEVADAGALLLAQGGVAIEGVVHVPFEASVERWHVRAVRTDVPRALPAWEGVVLCTAEPRVREGVARPDANGFFRIAGLDPGRYTLSVVRGDGPEIFLPSPRTEVSAPASGVVVGENLGCARITLRCEGSAPDVVGLGVQCDGFMESRGGLRCADEMVVVADRDLAYTLSAFAAGHAKAEGVLPPPRATEERLELVLPPNVEYGALELAWTLAPGLVAPEHVTAHWRREGQEGEATAKASASGCRFENWLPGRYSMTLEPRGDPWEPATSAFCTAPFEVELAADRTAHATVEWLAGGDVRFAPDASALPPELSSLNARVLDAQGRALAVRFVQRTYVYGEVQIRSWTGAMALRGTSELQPSLAPGAYQLVLSENDAELVRVPFTIVAGQTVEVAFVVP